MSKKSFISLLVCAVLIAGMLSGCGATANETPTTTATTAAQTQQSTAPAVTAQEPVSIVMERPLWGDTADPANAPNMRIREKFKEKLNIDVEVLGDLNPSDQNQKPNLMIAAGEKLDIFQTNHGQGTDWRKYKQEGTIIPLNDLLNKFGQNLLKYVDPNSFKQLTDEDGKIWALPDETNPVVVGLIVRKDWLQKNNLAVPVTIEDLENVMKIFKEKENDQGWVPSWTTILNNTFAGSFIPTGDQTYKDTDGKLKPWFMHPGAKEFLAKMQDWYKKGYIHKEFATMQNQQFNEIVFSGKSGFASIWTSNDFQDWNVNIQKNVPEGEFQVIAPPKGPEGGLITAGLPTSCDIMITKSSTAPEAAIKFLDYSQATDEGYLLAKYGEEGTDYEWADKANNVVKLTDKTPGVDRYGYAIFCSTRLNAFGNKYSSNALNSQTSLFMMDSTKYPSSLPIDAFVQYDIDKMKSKDQINTMRTFIEENEWKVVMGQIPVSEWDNIVKKWLEIGGQQNIEDMTEQFNAQQK